MLVRVLHGFAHRTKQLQPLVDRARVLNAILREWDPVDVLHDKPWSAIVEGVGVVEPRDRWMSELCERALLAGEAFAASRRQPGIAQELDRNQAAEVGAFREIDHAHPALAERVLDAVGPE